MTKRIFLFVLISCGVICGLQAQGLQSLLHNHAGQSLAYDQYQASGSPEVALVVMLADSMQALNAEDAHQDLVALANANNARMILVDARKGWNVDAVKSLLDATDVKKLRRICLASACQTWPNEYAAVPTVMLGPVFQGRVSDSLLESVFIAKPAIKSDDRFSDSLSLAGAWVKTESYKMAHPWFFDQRVEVIENGLKWLDSIASQAGDSVSMAKFAQRPLLSNELPEVLREGKDIVLNLNIHAPATYKVQLVNLSAEIVSSEARILGRGTHTIKISTKGLPWGVYHLEIATTTVLFRQKIMIRG